MLHPTIPLREPKFTADPHFWHSYVIPSCKRPFASVEEMNDEIVRRWNEVVDPVDLIYIVGDFSFGGVGKVQSILSRLNGRKILVKGNHDRHHKDKKWLEMGMTDVVEEAQVLLSGQLVTLSHFPFQPSFWERVSFFLRHWRKMDTRYWGKRPKDRGQWLIHGHVHCAWKKRRKMINVGMDQWDYRPVSASELKKLIENHTK